MLTRGDKVECRHAVGRAVTVHLVSTSEGMPPLRFKVRSQFMSLKKQQLSFQCQLLKNIQNCHSKAVKLIWILLFIQHLRFIHFLIHPFSLLLSAAPQSITWIRSEKLMAAQPARVECERITDVKGSWILYTHLADCARSFNAVWIFPHPDCSPAVKICKIVSCFFVWITAYFYFFWVMTFSRHTQLLTKIASRLWLALII